MIERFILLFTLIFISLVIYLLYKHYLKEKKYSRREEFLDRILRAPNLAAVYRIAHPNVVDHENCISQERNSDQNQHNTIVVDHLIVDPTECQLHRQIVTSINVQPNAQQLNLPPSYNDELPPTYDECVSNVRR